MELSDDALRSIVAHLAHIRAEYGEVLGEPDLVQPNGDFFPDEFKLEPAAIDRLMRRMMTYAPLSTDLEVEVVFVEAEGGGGGGCGSGACGTGGKSAANAQAPEFSLAVTGPDAKDDSLKSLAAFAVAAKKQVAAGASDVKLDKDKELKLDGESALSFDGSKTGKTGPAKFHQVVAVHNGMGYSISLACDPATFDGEWAAAQAVFDSIKWSK